MRCGDQEEPEDVEEIVIIGDDQVIRRVTIASDALGFENNSEGDPDRPGRWAMTVVSGRRCGKSGFLRKVGMLGKGGELRELPEWGRN